MTEPTPGPWTVARQATKQSEGEMFQKPLFIKDDSDKPVCIMGSGNVHYANAEANAHLIAAAPALLEALETIFTSITASGYQRVTIAEYWACRGDELANARAAIAAARPETTPPTANNDTPGIWWAEAEARRQDRGESLGEPWK